MRINKFIIGMLAGVLCVSATTKFQEGIAVLEESYRDYFSKIIARFDSMLQVEKVPPPVDSATISITVYEPLLETDEPRDYQLRIGASQALSRGDYRAIIDSLELVTRQNDTDFRLLANTYYRLNDLNRALDMGEKISNPEGETLYALGLLAMKLKNYNKAVKHFKAAISKNAELDSAYARLGDSYYLIQDYDNALKSWLQANERDINLPYLKYFIGFIYFEKKDLENAAKYFATIDRSDSERNWFLRAQYFRALIEERRGSREVAFDIFSKIELPAAMSSNIEYDILKKKIYSHFWLGLKSFSQDQNKALLHFDEAQTLIIEKRGRFVGNDGIVVDLLNGILERLREDLDGKRKHSSSSMAFYNYTETKLNNTSGEILDDGLKLISAQVMFFCEEYYLAARFFKALESSDPIAKLNYYVLLPSQLTPSIAFPSLTCNDTLAAYILINRMAIAYFNKNYSQAESLYRDIENCLKLQTTLKAKVALQYYANYYRSRWLESLLLDKPLELRNEMDYTKKILNELVRQRSSLKLPKYIYLPDSRMLILAVRRFGN